MTIIDDIRKTILDNNLIEKDDLIIVGASGGPDSQFLVYALNELKNELKFDIILAHFNHLHRKEAKEDEMLVKETADKLGLSFVTKSQSMDDFAKSMKISPEDAGRRLRYEFFRSIEKDRNPKIAVAHTLDDQAETVLMRIIRGTGVNGLVAMTYKNDDIIRPILDIKKQDLLVYLDDNSIRYHIDKTNNETDYTRNKIRLEIIPQIEKINPNFKKSLVNLSHIAADETSITDRYIENLYAEVLLESKDSFVGLNKKAFERLDYSLRAKILRRAILDIKGEIKDISKENIDRFLEITSLDTGKSIIKDDLILTKSYNQYRLYINKPNDKTCANILIDIGDEIRFGTYKIKVTKVDSYKKKKSKNVEYFDIDKLSFPLKVRFRENGDFIKPIGMNHRKKLKDLFIDYKVDKFKRDNIPLILSRDDIIWVAGLRSSEDYKVDPSTKNIIKIEVEDDNWLQWNYWQSVNRWRKLEA